MKILIVAHLNDEILYFDPQWFDKIYVCFSDMRSERANKRISKLMAGYPLRMELLGLKETDTLRDNYDYLIRKLKGIVEKDIEFWTHNPWGEYGNTEHILVHQAVLEIAERFQIGVWGFNGITKIEGQEEYPKKLDIDFLERVYQLYKKHHLWKERINFRPKHWQNYYKLL